VPEEKIKKEGNMKRLLWLLLVGIVVVGLLLAGCAGGGTGKIRVATDATWEPFEYIQTNTTEIVGFDIDLFDAIAARANLTVEYVDVSWDPLLAGMAQGTYDAAISSITIKPDRLEKMNFSHPYYVAGQIITTLTSNTDITGPETLAGKLVGVQTGTTGDDEAKSINGTTVVGYDEIGLAFVALLTNQIDAVICDTPVASGYVDKYDTLKTVGEVLTTEEYGIAVAKGKEDLLAKINTALDALLAEGIIDQLTAKWLVH
jgi:polar amino acid transport system substrate-binding protein